MSQEHPEQAAGDHVDQRGVSGTEPTRPLDDPATPEPMDEAPRAETSTAGWTAAAEQHESAERRRLSVSHLVTGLVFLGIAGLWLAQETGAVAVDDLDLLVPLLLVVVGAAGLVAGLTRAVRDRD